MSIHAISVYCTVCCVYCTKLGHYVLQSENRLLQPVVASESDVCVFHWNTEQEPGCTSFQLDLHKTLRSDKTQQPVRKLICMQDRPQRGLWIILRDGDFAYRKTCCCNFVTLCVPQTLCCGPVVPLETDLLLQFDRELSGRLFSPLSLLG